METKSEEKKCEENKELEPALKMLIDGLIENLNSDRNQIVNFNF